jgi:pimeloyl-ACP methyl ester carboxylesterase
MPQEPVQDVGPNAGDGPAGDVAERFMRRMIGDDRWARLPSSTRAARRAEGPALIADVAWLHGTKAPYDAAELTQPVVAGYGSQSKPYHQRAAEELAASVDDGELMVVEGADHGAHLSHPQDFAQFVRRAVARTRRVPAP